MNAKELRRKKIMDSIGDKEKKLEDMVRLLVECRDALPAITMTVAKLRNLDLTLADRIEECLKPWELSEEEMKDESIDKL